MRASISFVVLQFGVAAWPARALFGFATVEDISSPISIKVPLTGKHVENI